MSRTRRFYVEFLADPVRSLAAPHMEAAAGQLRYRKKREDIPERLFHFYTTMLTNLPGTTITFFGGLPSTKR